MTFLNEGGWDRAARLLAGIPLLIVGAWFVSGVVSTVLVVAGFLGVVTAVSGWCPAYTVTGMSTRHVTGAGCPSCETGHHV